MVSINCNDVQLDEQVPPTLTEVNSKEMGSRVRTRQKQRGNREGKKEDQGRREET